jgi:hypothetical protein
LWRRSLPDQLFAGQSHNHGSAAFNDPYLMYELLCTDSMYKKVKFGSLPNNRIHFLYTDGHDWDDNTMGSSGEGSSGDIIPNSVDSVKGVEYCVP